VFLAVADPVALGLVESLAHPGGNVTGFATLVPEGFVGKQLQLLKALVPQASRIAVLINPTNPMHSRELPKLPEFGRPLGVELVVVEASTSGQLETAHTQGVNAIDVFGDALTFIHLPKVVGLAARYELPAMHLWRQSVLDGDFCPLVQTSATSPAALPCMWTKS
jgi:putative ABC transport system substrate-binding protein